jgi:hypothetical protein
MFKKNAEFFGILALVNAPESTNLHASLNKTKPHGIKILMINLSSGRNDHHLMPRSASGE